MKKFVLGILTVFAWIFEILFGIGAVLSVILAIMSLIPNIQTSILKQISSTNNVSGIIFITFCALLLSALMCIAICWSINSIRLVIENINDDVYFDRSNLNLLRSTLVGLSIFTISDFIESCLMAIARYNLKGRTTLNLDFSNAVYSLIILGIIYVIYLVFKNGLKLQEESNKII
ncbi:DUF2975 domain-containing protein [Lactobacillus hominis]|uniref:DUF2975 domain-containing protein n=1 Tax=Lactobacillus hominis TaxID=1203033 RepID=UPI0023EF9A18|nr:DUF2975 domain-containing protein [Lactobacillus hominis]